MRGYLDTVTRALRAPATRTDSRRGKTAKVRGRRTTYLPVNDEMLVRALFH